MSSLVKIDNRKKDILIFGKRPTEGLKHTLSAEKMYSINFTVAGKKFCLSLHYNGANSYLFVNGTEVIKFKNKRFWNCSNSIMLRKHYKKNFWRQHEKDRIKWICLRFSVDYDAVAVDDILDIHNYLMKKNNIVQLNTWVN